jgi:hypothetical protein|tara:strand:+ start:2853 stop:3704 length:852 start_codon:yes stop_codon:yes gene_type:complete
MAVTINAKGTSVPYFKIGKSGTTFYQGDSDPSGTHTINENDVWFDTSNNTIKFRVSSAWSGITTASDLTVTGDLTVQGTTTTVNSTEIQVQNSLKFEGSTSNDYETNLTVVNPTADRTITLPNADDTLVGKATTDTLTNKSVDLTTNTLSGTLSEFNTALSDDDFVSLTGTETLTNKTLTSPTINGSEMTSTGAIVMPVGTTAQRPGTGVVGMMRFNSDIDTFEGYNGASWVKLGGMTPANDSRDNGLITDSEVFDVDYGAITDTDTASYTLDRGLVSDSDTV